MNVTLIVIVCVFIIGVILLSILGNKKVSWYKIHLANPEQTEEKVYRTLWDRWWALDAGAFVTFRRENGQKVRIGKHWIIKIESE